MRLSDLTPEQRADLLRRFNEALELQAQHHPHPFHKITFQEAELLVAIADGREYRDAP